MSFGHEGGYAFNEDQRGYASHLANEREPMKPAKQQLDLPTNEGKNLPMDGEPIPEGRAFAERNDFDDPPKPRRGLDPELQAMAKLERIIAELPEDATQRVLCWLMGRYIPGAKASFRVERVTDPESPK